MDEVANKIGRCPGKFKGVAFLTPAENKNYTTTSVKFSNKADVLMRIKWSI